MSTTTRNSHSQSTLSIFVQGKSCLLLNWKLFMAIALDHVLRRLAQASPGIKKRVLHACAYAVAADNLIQAEEAELLRAIAETLDCPIPPFIQGVA